jgi:hypothetical protein
MRLGAPLFRPSDDPDAWIAALAYHRYRAAFCLNLPRKSGHDEKVIL